MDDVGIRAEDAGLANGVLDRTTVHVMLLSVRLWYLLPSMDE